jgi:hypothetical protein
MNFSGLGSVCLGSRRSAIAGSRRKMDECENVHAVLKKLEKTLVRKESGALGIDE